MGDPKIKKYIAFKQVPARQSQVRGMDGTLEMRPECDKTETTIRDYGTTRWKPRNRIISADGLQPLPISVII